VQVKPAGETVEARATVPVNPLSGATVIVEVAATPAATVTLVGLAVTEKSSGAATVTVTVVEWESVPLVPVTVTVYVPGVELEQFSVEVPEPVTLVGLNVHVSPVGDTVEARETIPLNPLSAVTVIVDDPEDPEVKETLVGLAAIVKSGGAVTVTATVAECDSVPLVPVTVTV